MFFMAKKNGVGIKQDNNELNIAIDNVKKGIKIENNQDLMGTPTILG